MQDKLQVAEMWHAMCHHAHVVTNLMTLNRCKIHVLSNVISLLMCVGFEKLQ